MNGRFHKLSDSIIQQLSRKSTVTLSSPISDLELKNRVERSMRNYMDILTVKDLVARTADDLLKLPGLGKPSVAQVEEKLARHGFQLTKSKNLERAYYYYAADHISRVKLEKVRQIMVEICATFPKDFFEASTRKLLEPHTSLQTPKPGAGL